MKKTLKQFLVEKKNKDHEDKFKDVDCKSKDLTEEEKAYCNERYIVDLMYKSVAGN